MSDLPHSEQLVLVGRCYKPHGVKGEMKVIPVSDEPERLLELATVYVGAEADAVTAYEVTSARIQTSSKGPLVLLKLDGVDTPEDVQGFRQQFVFAHEDALPLDEDEFFLHELLGMTVETESGELVGVIHDTMQLPAHDVYVVARDGRPDVMIPAVEEFIKEIDFDARRIVIHEMEGLLE